MKKTQKSFRKKALLSSLSMLLVSTVAVGSATFAWFTSNPFASAKGLQMKATSSKGLMIQTQSHRTVSSNYWGHDDYLNSNDDGTASKTDLISLNPTSFDITDKTLAKAYTVEAEKSNASTAVGTAKVKAAQGGIGTGDYYQENIYCKVTGDTTGGDLYLRSITFDSNVTNVPMSDALRIAIQYNDVEPGASDGDPDVTTTTLLGVYSLASAAQKNKYLSVPEGTTFVSESTAYSEFAKTDKTFTVAPTDAKLGSVGIDGKDYVTVTIYLDGESSLVYTDAVSIDKMISNVTINLQVKETPAEP